MIESYKDAVEEYKRVDHLYHVSLKYTRTVDVIRSVIERIISTFEHSLDSILKVWKEENIISEIPESPVGKANMVKEKIEEEQIETLELYLKLRKIMRAPFGRREEFRRHVTMICDFDGADFEVDIDLLKEYYLITGEFLSFLKTKIEPYKDREE